MAKKRGWHLLFVVPHATRLRWLRHRVARVKGRTPSLACISWVATLSDIRRDGLDTIVTPIEPNAAPARLATILNDPKPRRIETPVASDAWLRLLATAVARNSVMCSTRSTGCVRKCCTH